MIVELTCCTHVTHKRGSPRRHDRGGLRRQIATTAASGDAAPVSAHLEKLKSILGRRGRASSSRGYSRECRGCRSPSSPSDAPLGPGRYRRRLGWLRMQFRRYTHYGRQVHSLKRCERSWTRNAVMQMISHSCCNRKSGCMTLPSCGPRSVPSCAGTRGRSFARRVAQASLDADTTGEHGPCYLPFEQGVHMSAAMLAGRHAT